MNHTALKTRNDPHPSLLLAEDDEIFRHVLSRALAERGYDVIAARDLADAERLAEDHRPSYAVVDLRLGDDSGLELIDRLTRISPGIRAVILTGYASIATAVEAIKLGATYYLTKPVDADEVVAALHRDEGNPGISPAERPCSVKRLEWEHIQQVLQQCQGNISETARKLGMHRRTLQRKLQKRPVRH
ncbi:two-component system response regulator [Acidihalobacter yilgarnensis]|uniref:Two-component system response regulator n=1 Tax=Acidihalobacter yilgarnensis TaxID=2819280 RepID=A0A1D8IRU2_9GAMM|nr:response regulator transcription factor [Acidihalobacter yilgarnensis]AOU99064.1 two-component system response regulator [Acidihalobacter yilgarnensis]